MPPALYARVDAENGPRISPQQSTQTQVADGLQGHPSAIRLRSFPDLNAKRLRFVAIREGGSVWGDLARTMPGRGTTLACGPYLSRSARRRGRMRRSIAIVTILSAVLATAGVAYADDLKFAAELSGAEENPPVETEGEGEAKFESDGSSVDFELKWDDLSTPAFAAHIHCGARRVNGPVGVTLFASPPAPMDPAGEVSGTFTAPDVGNACGWDDLAEVLAAMTAGTTYVNVHTTQNRGGEIRGQVTTD